MIGILRFINALRETDEYIEMIYTKGGCYKFHLLLKQMYPECEPMINIAKGHVATLYEGELYDINGVVKQEVWERMTEDDISEAKKWSFAKHNWISLGECPHCGEEITI